MKYKHILLSSFIIRSNLRVAQTGGLQQTQYIPEVAPWLPKFWILGSLKAYQMHSLGPFALRELF